MNPYRKSIESKIAYHQGEAERYLSVLKVMDDIENEEGIIATSQETEEGSEEYNAQIIYSIIKEGEKANPPQKYSSGTVIEKFAEKKGARSKSDVANVVYNTLSKMKKRGSIDTLYDEIETFKYWKTIKP